MTKAQTIELIKTFFEANRVQELDRQQAIEHFYLLGYVLGKSRPIFQLHNVEHVAAHIPTLKDTLEVLVSKHVVLDDMEKEYPLTIDPESGYPTLTDLFYIRKDKEEAAAKLKEFPPRDQIIENARDYIFAGQAPEKQQKMLMRMDLLKMMKGNDLFPELNAEIQQGRGDKDFRYYSIEWYGLESNTGIPIFYRMLFTQEKYAPSLEEKKNDKLSTMILTSMNINQSPLTLAYAINTEIEEICPRIVQRVSLGPFFSKYTKNTDEVNKLFMGIDNPYLLAINIENAAVSVTQRMPSTRLMKRMLGQMVEKANYHNTEQLVFVAPFRLQQEILDPNYTEKEIKRDAIYGITEKGELNECYKR